MTSGSTTSRRRTGTPPSAGHSERKATPSPKGSREVGAEASPLRWSARTAHRKRGRRGLGAAHSSCAMFGARNRARRRRALEQPAAPAPEGHPGPGVLTPMGAPAVWPKIGARPTPNRWLPDRPHFAPKSTPDKSQNTISPGNPQIDHGSSSDRPMVDSKSTAPDRHTQNWTRDQAGAKFPTNSQSTHSGPNHAVHRIRSFVGKPRARLSRHRRQSWGWEAGQPGPTSVRTSANRFWCRIPPRPTQDGLNSAKERKVEFAPIWADIAQIRPMPGKSWRSAGQLRIKSS